MAVNVREGVFWAAEPYFEDDTVTELGYAMERPVSPLSFDKTRLGALAIRFPSSTNDTYNGSDDLILPGQGLTPWKQVFGGVGYRMSESSHFQDIT